jgi:hypothetical protein
MLSFEAHMAKQRGRPRRSSCNGSTTDAADLELLAFPPCNRDEEQRQLLELPHPRPLRGVMAARTGANLSGAKVFLLGAVAENEEQHITTVGDQGWSDACTNPLCERTVG